MRSWLVCFRRTMGTVQRLRRGWQSPSGPLPTPIVISCEADSVLLPLVQAAALAGSALCRRGHRASGLSRRSHRRTGNSPPAAARRDAGGAAVDAVALIHRLRRRRADRSPRPVGVITFISPCPSPPPAQSATRQTDASPQSAPDTPHTNPPAPPHLERRRRGPCRSGSAPPATGTIPTSANTSCLQEHRFAQPQ